MNFIFKIWSKYKEPDENALTTPPYLCKCFNLLCMKNFCIFFNVNILELLQPYGFDVGQSERGTVLKGLDLGVQGMRVGGQVRPVSCISLLYLCNSLTITSQFQKYICDSFLQLA